MSLKINQELIKIFQTLSDNKDINFVNNGEVKIGNQVGEILRISEQVIKSPINDIEKLLVSKISPLPDQLPEYELLSQFIGELNKLKAIKGLNHIGFCYHVSSQEQEKSRLLSETLPGDVFLYEEPSNDLAKWYFVGNTDNWESPMIELLPAESNNYTFIDYWMPHIHIDIDTTLDENQIESLLYKIYDGDPKPFRCTVIDDVIYTVRTRLGIIDGVNLFLDLSTNHRDIEYSRKNILKRLTK